eukprot:7385713-Prymnesium_polylepis.2
MDRRRRAAALAARRPPSVDATEAPRRGSSGSSRGRERGRRPTGSTSAGRPGASRRRRYRPRAARGSRRGRR